MTTSWCGKALIRYPKTHLLRQQQQHYQLRPLGSCLSTKQNSKIIDHHNDNNNQHHHYTIRTMSSRTWKSLSIIATPNSVSQHPQQQQCHRSFTLSSTPSVVVTTPWADPAMRRYKFWNREDDSKKSGQYSYLLEISPESVKHEARIISLADMNNDDASSSLHDGTNLPLGSRLLKIGTTLNDFEHLQTSLKVQEQPNVIFVSPSCPKASIVLPAVLNMFPSIKWIHVRSAGIDFVESDEFAAITTKKQIMVTNAKGQFSSSLAEYALMACSYFAKNIPRLMDQKNSKIWKNYNIEELYVYIIFIT